MKVLITESKRDHIVIKWLDNNYGDLTPYETDEYPDFIFFMKDGEIIFDYNKKNGWIYVSYDKIWSLLESFFGLEFEETQALTKEWLEEHYKLDIIITKTFPYDKSYGKRWRNITNYINNESSNN